MKKLILGLLMTIGIASAAQASDTYTHDASVLPAAARNTIAKNFKAMVSVVKIEKTLGYINEYEAVLTDGTEISFDRDGNWDNIEVASNKSVPSSLVPESITQYVAKTQKGQRIVGIDKSRSGYEVDLSNGLEMKFNKSGQFVRFD